MSAPSVRRGTVTIRLPEGLHLRPLSIVSREAQKFSADVTLRKGNQLADAKRPLDLMTLAAACGEDLELETTGSDADSAFEAIKKLFDSDFAEDP